MSVRFLLFLSLMGPDVEYRHFKMESLESALTFVTKDCYIASVDLTKAYYLVSVHPDHRKYLRFQWKGSLYQYNVLPNGLSQGPYLFSKIMKVLTATLCSSQIVTLAYIDDTL